MQAHQPFILLNKTHDIDPTRKTNSWFGGAPKLGSTNWPKFADGRPGLFFAQIGLEDLPSGPWTDALPTQGALAFFSSGVRHVPSPGTEVSTPPGDIRPMNAGREWDFFEQADSQAPCATRLRHWPMSPILIDTPYSDAESKTALIGAHKSMDTAPLRGARRASSSQPVYPVRYLDYLISQLEARIDAMKARTPSLFAMQTPPSEDALNAILAPIEKILSHIKMARREGDDPFALISQHQLANVKQNTELLKFLAPFVPSANWYFSEGAHVLHTSLFDLIRKDCETWNDLSADVQERHRSAIDGTERCYHQAFGTGPFFNGENTDYHGYHLLFRFHEDMALGWDTQNDQDLKFLISEDDLRAGRFENAIIDASSGA